MHTLEYSHLRTVKTGNNETFHLVEILARWELVVKLSAQITRLNQSD